MSIIVPSSQSKSRALIPPWLMGLWGMVGLLAILYTIADLAWTYFHWGGPEHVAVINDLLAFPSSLFVIMTAWRVATLGTLNPSLRRAWFLLGLGFLMFFIGNVIWAYLGDILHIEPFPSIADVFYLGLYPFTLWGTLTLSGFPRNWRERSTFWLDLLSVFVAAAMFVAYFVIAPTATANNSDLLTQMMAIAYPIGSLILIGAMIALLYRRPDAATQSALIYFMAGMAFFIVSDFAFGYTSLAGTYVIGGWIDAGWNVAQLFFALAALRQIQFVHESKPKPGVIRILDALAKGLPFAAVILSYGLVFYVNALDFSVSAEWLLVAAVLLTMLMITRQVLAPSFVNISVRAKLILTLLFICAFSAGLVTFFTYLNLRSNLESAVGDNLKTQAEMQAQNVMNLINKQVDVVESFVLMDKMEKQVALANAQYTGDLTTIQAQLQLKNEAWMSAGDGDPLVEHVLTNITAAELHEFLEIFHSHTDILVTDRYGATLAAITRPDQYYQANEEWWQAAYDNGEGDIYIGQPTFDPVTHTTNLVIAMPIRANLESEELVGIVRTLYNIQDISTFLASSHQSIDSDLLLGNGKLLKPSGEIVSLDPETLARLHGTANTDYTQMNLEGALQLVSQAHVTAPDPEEVLAFKNLDWTLIGHQDAKDAFAPVTAAQRTALLTIMVVLIVTAGIAVLIAQLFVAPISRLTVVAGRIASGDFSAKAQVESQDEIGKLASTFNTMLNTLSHTQKELQESEALYRSLVDYSPDVITVHSQGKILFINPAGVQILGAKSAEELIDKRITDFVPALDPHHVRQGIDQIQTIEGTTPLMQQTLHRIDGTPFEAEFRSIPISYAGQPATQFVMRDITERKSLEQQWQKFKMGIEQSTDAVFITDVDGTIRYINPAFEKLYGYFWDEAVGQTPRILKSGTLSQEVYQNFWETLLSKGSARGELVNRTKDGRLINIESSATPILAQAGNLVGFLAVQRDVTERKKAEEKIHQLLAQVARQRGELEIRVAQRTEELNSLNQLLKSELIERQRLVQSLSDSETRFRLLFESSPDAILLIDPNDPDTSWPIVDCNEVACTMNGYRREEMIGQSIDLLNATRGDPAERKAYLEFLRQQGVLHRDGVHLHRDGHIFPIEVSSSLIRFGDRELVLGIDRDITERKQAEEALSHAKEAAEASQQVAEAASRAKSEFLSRMSHELRTPMNAILGFAQLLEMSQKEPLTSSQQERVKQIVKGGQHLLDLINEILDISRIEANRLQISPEPVSIRESVEEVLDLTVPLAVKRHVQIVTRLGNMDSNPFVLADRQRLKQVLLNLLGNAVKYNFDGGSVIITSQMTPGNKWRISVSDTGPGIAQENLGRLFVPFERLNDDQPNVEGTGLGLVLAKRLIELMKGQIGVESVLGKGSTFWIELPPGESPVERLHRMGGTGDLRMVSAAARTILYVEDNVANFELIREVLADYSEIRLIWAADVKTGFEKAREHQPHLILLDLHLGAVDGAELLEQLKQDPGTAEIPVIVVSADATSHQAERLKSLGAHTYLTKPLHVKHFIELVEDLLGEKEI
jgi:PAS domain S-box-containing protein